MISLHRKKGTKKKALIMKYIYKKRTLGDFLLPYIKGN